MDEKRLIENFGKRVAFLRKERHLSQEALALDCNLNRTYIGDIERGEKCPSLVTISKIANGLGISVKELLDYEC